MNFSEKCSLTYFNKSDYTFLRDVKINYSLQNPQSRSFSFLYKQKPLWGRLRFVQVGTKNLHGEPLTHDVLRKQTVITCIILSKCGIEVCFTCLSDIISNEE